VASDTPAPDPRSEVLAAIPHRDPFLFVDRIVERSGPPHAPTHLVTEWMVPKDGDWFRGHYPGHPILPGVLVSEFAFQSAAVLLSSHVAGRVGVLPVLIGIENARFKSTVEPGEVLRAEVELLEELSGKHYMRGFVTCGGRTVLRLRFTVALTHEEQRAAARSSTAPSGTVTGG